MIIGLIGCFFWKPEVWMTLVMMVPMIADGFIQLKTRYESTNPRRFVTGLLFGYGLMALFIISTLSTIRLGYQFGQQII